MTDFLRAVSNQAITTTVNDLINDGMCEAEILQTIDNRLLPAYEVLIEKAGNNIFQCIHDHAQEIVNYWNRSDSAFMQRMEEKWGKCFEASQVLYGITLEAAQNYNEYVHQIPTDTFSQKKCAFDTLLHLHGRACQEYLEIQTLLKGGFADGAYARCRSLYELCCISNFIQKFGESVAKAFLQQPKTKPGSKGFPWAQSVKDDDGKPVRSFKQIQDLCDIPTQWRSCYDLQCQIVHGSPDGTFGRLANGDSMNVIPVGRSDYGIMEPGCHSALCLRWITTELLTLFIHVDSLAVINALQQWTEIIIDLYTRTDDVLFGETSSHEKE